jgi:hypothetical protein
LVAAWVERDDDPPQAPRTKAAANTRTSELMACGLRGGPSLTFFANPRGMGLSVALVMSTVHRTRPPKRATPALIGALDRRLPFWAPQAVILCAILLDLALPGKLTIGPSWLLPALEGVLWLGLIAASPNPRWRHNPLRRRIAIGLTGLVSAANSVSLVLLVHYLLHGGKENGRSLIYSGMVLWLTNVLLFGIWYWELDRGGPLARRSGDVTTPDFLFPQMSQPDMAPEGWSPGLVDYLYTSYTNATAFSPTDTMPLTPIAKWLMTAQSLTALVTIGLVVARAVNILS